VEAIRGIDAIIKALLPGAISGVGVCAFAGAVGGVGGVLVHPLMLGFADCFMVGIIGS
jgi:hypothetical protein